MGLETLAIVGASVASVGLGAASAAGAFTDKPKMPEIPTRDSKAVQEAAAQERARRALASGRESTIFTNLASESPGRGAYGIGGSSLLGGGNTV